MVQYLDIGKIVNTHGVRGEVKVAPLTDDIQRFEKLKKAYMERNGSIINLDIESVRYFKNNVLLKFKGVDDLDSATALRGFCIKVDRTNAVRLPKDSYFICDIIGSTVVDESGKELGKLCDVLKTGSNDVYLVRDSEKKEILIPALKTVVKDISIEKGIITVSLPEGLVDDEV